ncbi:hypothetical protein GCM10023216_11750 [Isoptericola chiayiensis]|uniref:Uncharacterized protein n=1 Tax=Isoptericola chiayiensis TaxID=579446 RepID=A0ABP8Y8Z0_9MICO|nr:hypothetical protein [Isoptericola chiayiensis]NOW00811.1 hypothetical protein [Isoptericola chiayiensis]
MSYVQALVPPQHAANHVLVLPDGGGPSVVELASAWFADVRWLREPQAATTAAPIRGARFRGMAASESRSAGPGVLGIGAEHGAAGPFPVAAEVAPQAGLDRAASAYALGRVDGMIDRRQGPPAVTDDRDGIARAFAAGLPEGEELRLVQFGVAAARKLGGSLLADGRHLLRPDPTATVDLTLYSAHPIAPADLLGLLRSQVATADLADERTAPDGSRTYRAVAATPYDGTITAEVEHVDRVPRALADLDWREYGPHVVRVGWTPQDPYELQVEQPSGVHVIARARMRAMVARLVLLLQARLGGVVVDDGAFVATTAEIERRTDEQRTASRAWV